MRQVCSRAGSTDAFVTRTGGSRGDVISTHFGFKFTVNTAWTRPEKYQTVEGCVTACQCDSVAAHGRRVDCLPLTLSSRVQETNEAEVTSKSTYYWIQEAHTEHAGVTGPVQTYGLPTNLAVFNQLLTTHICRWPSNVPKWTDHRQVAELPTQL